MYHHGKTAVVSKVNAAVSSMMACMDSEANSLISRL